MRVVLVRPQHGGNVGAVCRAIKNMGAGELWLVGAEIDAAEARRSAVHAADVFEARRQTSDLASALAGCSLVVGTTARRGRYHERSRDIRELTGDIAAAERLGAGRGPALVFGPEDTGLHNEDIALCHRLAFVPTDEAYASLNLAQAVLLCLYDVARERARTGDRQRAHTDDKEPACVQDLERAHADARRTDPAPGTQVEAPSAGAETLSRADAADVERMYGEMEAALLAIGFLSDDNPKHVMQALRGLLGRAGVDERELRVLRGIARQIGWFAGGGREVAQRKRDRGEKLR